MSTHQAFTLTTTDLLATIAPSVTLPRNAKGRIGPAVDGKQYFVIGVDEGVAQDAPCQLTPTATLYRDGTAIRVWAFSEPVDARDPQLVALADALDMPETTEHIPDPEREGWEVDKLGARHDFAKVYGTYVGAVGDVAEAVAGADATRGLTEGSGAEGDGASGASFHPPVPEGGNYGDAVCVTPYDESLYGDEIVITLGSNRQSKKWKTERMPVGKAVTLVVRHKEGPKDGPAFVLGDMVPGQRLKTSVKALYGVGLDIDTGTPTVTVDAALKKVGCLAIRYSTNSSGKTKTEIKKDKVMKFAGDCEIDTDLIRNFLREVEQWDKSMIDNADYLGTEHTENGIVCQIAHPPMPKHRIVMFFKDPFVIEDEAKTQAEAMKKWAKVPEALARLLNVPFDTSCTDPSRLFYFPRHAKGKPFSISLFGGPYFDWRKLELDDPMERLGAALTKGKSKSVTDEGRELGRWHLKRGHGFQIADVIDAHAPDRIRHNTGRGYEIECPFDEDHNNAGDQEDRACLVVNAGEGPGEFFTISCRHESCRDKTMLDMLGKMLKDSWFTKDVLDDEQFNAILEDEDKPEVAVKLEKQDKARAGYEIAIAALTPHSTDDEVNAVAEEIVKANLPPLAEERAIGDLTKRLNTKQRSVAKIMQSARRKATPVVSHNPVTISERGHYTFRYTGDFDFLDACEVCSKALVAQNERSALPVYSHLNGKAVRLDIRNGRGEFKDMTQNSLWSELNKYVTFMPVSDGKAEGRRKEVDRNVAAHVYEQAYEQLPPAPEVLYTPIFLPDGSLVASPGYYCDPARPLNLLLLLNGLEVPDVPAKPSKAEMVEARDWILTELLFDFPFCDTDDDGGEINPSPSKAHAFAMLLTPFMRRMIGGCTPAFGIDKPTPGTGGTLLALLIIMLFEGADGEGSAINYTPKEDEMEKKLVAASFQTRSILFFDDVTEFNNRVILRGLTSEQMDGRVLGQSRNVTIKNNFIWINTGNNVQCGDEMRRRTCTIRLNAKTADMAARKYRHPDTSGVDYMSFVRQHRGLAIRHLLTLVQYWKEQGSPAFTERRLSSFEDWSKKVGGVLQACGVEGFLNAPTPPIPDLQKTAENEFLRGFYQRFGTMLQTATDIFNWAQDVELSIVSGGHPDERKRRFGGTLRALNNRTFADGGTELMFSAKTEDGDIKYGVQRLERRA